MKIYGTFIFGYPNDSEELINNTLHFSNEQKLFMAAFNHLVPFPGTDLYSKMERIGELKHEKWWLNENYRFGQLTYIPNSKFEAEDVEQCCMHLRRKFYSVNSIIKRMFDLKANCNSMQSAKTYLGLNILLRHEVNQKYGLPLGVQDNPPR